MVSHVWRLRYAATGDRSWWRNGRTTHRRVTSQPWEGTTSPAISPTPGRLTIAGYQPNLGAGLHRNGTRSHT